MEYLHNLIDYGILGWLLLMSVVALALAIERWLVYRATRVEQCRADRNQLLEPDLDIGQLARCAVGHVDLVLSNQPFDPLDEILVVLGLV